MGNVRLIDANALMQEFADRARAARNWKEGATMEGNSEAVIRADATLAFLSEVKLTIEKAPTVEPKTGEWVWRGHYLICSRCGSSEDRRNFCPNCGAKMLGGDANE